MSTASNSLFRAISRLAKGGRSMRVGKRIRTSDRLSLETLEQRNLFTAVVEAGVNDFRISDTGGTGDNRFGASQSHIAYNAMDHEYLVVWGANDPDLGLGDREIIGRFIDADSGNSRTGDFLISDVSEGELPFDPKVAWNSASNQFLVVWSDKDTNSEDNDDREIFGQLLSNTGGHIGDDFRISDDANSPGSERAGSPDVVFNPVTSDYLVTWTGTDPDDSEMLNASSGQRDLAVFVQLLDSSGTEVRNEFRISDVGGSVENTRRASRSAVAVSASTGEYLVTWQSNGIDTVRPDSFPLAIFGQTLNANGGETGNDFRISNDVAAEQFGAEDPAIAFNSITNQFLVAWIESVEPGEQTLRGQLVDEAGLFVGPENFGIAEFDAHQTVFNPDLAYNSRNNEYLLAWQGTTDQTLDAPKDQEILVQRVNAIGRPVGERIMQISDVDSEGGNRVEFSARGPAVIWNALSNEYFVTWGANDLDSPGIVESESEVFGQRLEVRNSVPLDLSAAFNVDAVANRIGNTNDAVQDPLSIIGQVLVTDSAAATAIGGVGNGLPDDGLFPAGEFHPDIQLPYAASGNGANAVLLDRQNSSIEVAVQPAPYYELHLAAVSVDGFSEAEVVVTYSDGTSDGQTMLVPDWKASIVDRPNRYSLGSGMDVALANGSTVQDVNNVGVLGFRFETDPRKQVSGIRWDRFSGTGRLVILGATGLSDAVQEITVTTVEDHANGNLLPNDISLREAVQMASSANFATTITFSPDLVGQTIALQHGEIKAFAGADAVDHSIRITGPGADQLTIDAREESRIFFNRGGSTLELNDMLLLGGEASFGGAIRNEGNLTLNQMAVRDSSAASDGGAIHHDGPGELAITGSEVSDSRASRGGGIYTDGQTTIVNSTISGNSARSGAGIHVADNGQAEARNVTVTDNKVPINGIGGGIHADHINDNLLMFNTIVAGNIRGDQSLIAFRSDVNGRIHSTSENNLIGDSTGMNGIRHGAGGNQVGNFGRAIDARLGLLGFNGGPTRTHALLQDSPAIDMGLATEARDASGNLLTTDQRGTLFDRVADGDKDGNARADIGAVEQVFKDPTRIPGDSNGDGFFNTSDLVMVFQAGEFEDGTPSNSTFEEGDWNGDGDFDTGDLVLAFQAGNFENGEDD